MKNKNSILIKFIFTFVLIATITQTNFIYATALEDEEVYESLLTTNEQEETDTGNLTYASGVTDEMCKPEYWASKIKDASKVLMTKSEISKLNQDIIDGAGTNVFDLTKINETKTPSERAQILANSEDIPIRNLYIDGTLIDNNTYFTKLKNAMIETGFDGDETVQKYAVAVKRADVRVWPTNDVIGYSETDPDDEIENSILNVNEPFVIRGKCEVDGKTFYWGNSNVCPGWVDAENLAICESKEEWIDAWQVDVSAKDFLVVTQDKITLEPSLSVPETSEIKLMIGTTLKLVSKSDLPKNIGERGTWNNYVVYLPTRDEDGNYVKQYALISQHYDVSIGFLPMTQENILKVAFSCLGNRYGWGGMLGAMDCSLYSRSIYECFGLELPRNTTWQMKVPGKVTDVSEKNDEEKEAFLEKQAVGAILFFPGHAMVYTGNENNTSYTISATGSLSDSIGELNVQSMYSVILNPLTTRRRNGRTWLNNLTYVLSFGENNEELIGDVNGNGIVELTDYSMILKHVKGIKLLEGEQLERADVNQNGNIDLTDYSMVLKHVKGIKLLN
ncbi:MAG: C40 family peptidase [Clostridia bacterium]|nr:C40 family peptidase [Clostridia bacterium]